MKLSKQLILFCIVFFVFAIKNVLAFSSMGFYNPYSPTSYTLDFAYFWIPKFSVALFLASFVFLFKNKIWLILLSFLCDIWLLTTIIYWNFNHVAISYDAITMVGNMTGFWSSLFVQLNFMNVAIILLSVVLTIAILIFFREKTKSNLKFFLITVGVVALILNPLSRISSLKTMSNPQFGYKIKYLFVPYYERYQSYTKIARWNFGEYFFYQKENISYFPWIFIEKIHKAIQTSNIVISKEDEQTPAFKSFLNFEATNRQVKQNNNLLVIVVESMESWFLKDSIADNIVMPNLKHFLDTIPHFYAPNLRAQTRGGSSGDGQMLINTSLPSTEYGGACMKYGTNTYPNFAHFFDYSYTINPCTPNVWNQNVINKHYGYKQLVQVNTSEADKFEFAHDEKSFVTLANMLDTVKEPFCIQHITYSTHPPYEKGKNSKLKFNKEYCENIQEYLSSFNYLDSCMAQLLSRITTDEKLKNATIVITADHTANGSSYKKFISQYNINIKNETFCPLIIVSPKIKENITVTDTCYQMDIFPTILNFVDGSEDYYFKGFGVNLMDSSAIKNRILSNAEANQLSDKLIPINYFSKFESISDAK